MISNIVQDDIERCRLRVAGIKYFVSETHFRLLDKPGRRWNNEDSKRSVRINLNALMSLENIHVLEIGNGEDKKYKISMPGISQDNYNHRVMLRGKQAEHHIISNSNKRVKK